MHTNNQLFSFGPMQKTSSTSNYDVLVIRHHNNSFKSTPFQAVFSEKALKARDIKKNKNKDLRLYINDEQIDLPMRVDPSSGRVQFQKKYIRKAATFSDSSDISDDERISTRSTSRERRIQKGILKGESVDQLKNEQVPKAFWQFAWLFNSKKETSQPVRKQPQTVAGEQPRLARIKQEPYEGEDGQKEPLFQLSLCGHLLAKVRKEAGKQELEKMFYANRVEYKDFIKDPLEIINDSKLVVRIDNSLYTWQLGAAILACKFAFAKEPGDKFFEVIQAKTKKSWFQIFGRDNVTKLDIQEKKPPTFQLPSKLDETQIVRYRKAPDSEMLKKMKLKMGENKAKFTLEVSPGQIEETQFKVFLWDQNEHIVVSDIDGTITKSDVMGQLKTNYIHKGVCLLYNELEKRNYKMLYMTARAIGQYTTTRKFLEKEVEENGMRLPPGPILMSPDGYLKSFTRQVIDKAPDQLKIKLLASVNEIFPNTKKPIIAGFGNRQTDSIAYLRIKIPPEKIFCINEKSVITNQKDKQFSTNYRQMLEKVEDYFPYYVKPQDSDHSNMDVISNQDSKNMDQNDDISVTARRKLSHSQFYNHSPKSKSQDGNEKAPEWFRSVGKAKSEEGEHWTQQIEQFQFYIKQYDDKSKKD